MIKGQFTKNGTFINILAILRPIWPQLCMLNKSASHLRTSFLVLVDYQTGQGLDQENIAKKIE